jgi:hypothetical protein
MNTPQDILVITNGKTETLTEETMPLVNSQPPFDPIINQTDTAPAPTRKLVTDELIEKVRAMNNYNSPDLRTVIYFAEELKAKEIENLKHFYEHGQQDCGERGMIQGFDDYITQTYQI